MPVGPWVCQAMRRFSSNSMTVLTIEYGSAHLHRHAERAPELEPSAARPSRRGPCRNRRSPRCSGRIHEEGEDRLGGCRDQPLDGLGLTAVAHRRMRTGATALRIGGAAGPSSSWSPPWRLRSRCASRTRRCSGGVTSWPAIGPRSLSASFAEILGSRRSPLQLVELGLGDVLAWPVVPDRPGRPSRVTPVTLATAALNRFIVG